MNVLSSKTSTLLLALALVSALPGCILAAVGAGAALGVVYIQGEHQVDMPGSPSEAVIAASAAVEAHGFILISSDADELSGEVVARTTADSMVRVRMQRLASGQSRVWVRIGALGQVSESRELLEAIRKRLDAPGPRQAVERVEIAANQTP